MIILYSYDTLPFPPPLPPPLGKTCLRMWSKGYTLYVDAWKRLHCPSQNRCLLCVAGSGDDVAELWRVQLDVGAGGSAGLVWLSAIPGLFQKVQCELTLWASPACPHFLALGLCQEHHPNLSVLSFYLFVFYLSIQKEIIVMGRLVDAQIYRCYINWLIDKQLHR